MKKSKLIIALTLSTLIGCTQQATLPSVQYAVAQSGDVQFLKQGLKHYAFAPKTGTAFTRDSQLGEQASQVFSQHIEDVLTEKGYVRVDNPASAQFIVAFGLASSDALDDEQIFQRTQLDTGVTQFPIDGELTRDKGTFAVAFYTPKNALPFWRALAQAATDGDASNTEWQERTKQIVGSVFNQVPYNKNW
ncbi:DUF4136 domain-containing protein [Vibrio maerlii]|uniref:DUF4136 domain-containing protein n=1 Tax=Vibrio maerlii TaxID=2231648 RepID=UPI0013DFA5AB|nr:DUF4136 domain-containing protein [Vibrio maerlii]